MMDVNGRYATYRHALERRCGKFWQGRFYTCVLDDAHWETALRYVELNPIRARIVDWIEDFRWSSTRAHLGLEPSPAWLDNEQLYRRWNHAAEWQSSLDTLTRREAAALRMATLHDAAWGSDEFVAWLERTHGVQLRTKPLGRSWPHPAKAPRSAGAAAGEVQLQA